MTMKLRAKSYQDDADVIAQSLQAPDAFAALYDRHAPAIYRFAARRLGEQAADDVVAETFLAAFHRRDRYMPGCADARPWLYGIASRVIGKHRRAEVRLWRAVSHSATHAVTDDETGAIDDRMDARSTQPALADAIARLSARDRDVLLLVAWAELSYDEVASALEIPVGTVRSRLSRARRQLRPELAGLQPRSPTEELCNERA